MQAASADAHRGIYLPFRDGPALLLSSWNLGSPHGLLHLPREAKQREAERDAIRVGSVVAVGVAVVVHIAEVGGRISRGRPEPPILGTDSL